MSAQEVRYACEEGVSLALPWPNGDTFRYLEQVGLCPGTGSGSESESDLLAPDKCQTRVRRVVRRGEDARLPPDALSGWHTEAQKLEESREFWEHMLWEAQHLCQEIDECQGDVATIEALHDDMNILLHDNVAWYLNHGGMIVSHFGLGGKEATSHKSFQTAVNFLCILAKHMPDDAAVEGITRMLFGLEIFLDFDQSDPHARGILMAGVFHVVDIMRHRNMDVTQAIKWICETLGKLLDEIETVDTLLATPLRLEFLQTTRLAWKRGMFKDDKLELVAYLKMLQKCNQEIVRRMLSHLQRLCCSMSSAADSGQGEAHIVCPSLVRCFDQDFKVAPEVRGAALDLVYIWLAIAEREDRQEMLASVRMPLWSELLATAAGLLDSCFHRRTPASSDAIPATTKQFVPGLIRLLGKLHGVRVGLGQSTLASVIEFAQQPHSADEFWQIAPADHRKMATTVVALALESVPGGAGSNRDPLVQFWMHALVDHACFKEQVYFTVVMSAHPELQDLVSPCLECSHLGREDSFDAWWTMGRHLLDKLHQGGDNGKLPALVSKLEKMVAKRDNDPLHPDDRLRWHQNTGALLVALLPRMPCALADTVLGTCCKWVFSAIETLQKMHFDAANQASDRVSSKAKAAGALRCSAARLLPHLITRFVSLGSPYKLQSNTPRLEAFAQLMAAFFHLPMAQTGPNPVDWAVFELLADAVGGCLVDGSGNSNHGSTAPTKIVLVQFILEYCVGMSLQSAHSSGPNTERSAINSLCFLQALLCHPQHRGVEVICTFVHWLLFPLISAMFPERGLSFVASTPTKTTMYTLLQHLFDNEHMVMEPPTPWNNVQLDGNIDFRGGPFHSGLPVSHTDLATGLRLFLTLCMRDLLGSVRALIPAAQLATVDGAAQPNTNCYTHLTQGTDEAREAGARSLVSIGVLFGRAYGRTAFSQKMCGDYVKVPHFGTQSSAGRMDASKKALAKESLLFLKALVCVSRRGASWALPALPVLKALLDTRCHTLEALHAIYRELLESVAGYGIDVGSFQPAVAPAEVSQHSTRTGSAKRSAAEEGPSVNQTGDSEVEVKQESRFP